MRIRGSIQRFATTTLALLVLATGATASPGDGNSAATITGSFGDACRNFSTHSSKDISHVEVHYVDGRVVKDESIASSGYSIDGAAGDEIDFATVKSGTTRESFDCTPSADHPPTALLEILTPPECGPFFSGGWMCAQSGDRTAWTATTAIPDDGGEESGWFHWGCQFANDPVLCPFAMTFRGTSSSDPDDDLVSWSIDFGDGTSASGDWSGQPPDAVTHTYDPSNVSVPGFNCACALITLTVTDSAGQSASDQMLMAFVDQTPD